MGNPSFVRSAGTVSACTLLSRILGMVRDVLSSQYFGATPAWDAFSIALRIPNLFRRLFGEGALTAAFLPAFVERYDTDRHAEAHALLNKLATALSLFLGLVVLAAIGVTCFLPDDPKSAELAPLLRITMPYTALICMAAILGAALNGLRHYFAPAFAPVLLNVAMIGALLCFVGNIHAVAWAVVIGGILELLILVPPLLSRRVPLRPQLDLRDPGLREVFRRFLPVVFGLALVQVNEVVGSLIAQYAVPGHGAVSALYYGNQITQLPLALIGTAVATVVFPLFASPKEDFNAVFGKAMRLVLFLALPATAGLLLLARPAVALLFEHGRFTPEDTRRAASVIVFYAAGLWCYCANHVQVRAFYAKKDTKTPVAVSAVMMLLNLTLSLSLVGAMQERGIALANSATGLATFVTLNILLRRKMGGLDLKPVYTALARSLLATVAMAAAVWGVCRGMEGGTGASLVGRLVLVFAPAAAGAVVYLLAARLLRMDESRMLFRRRPKA